MSQDLQDKLSQSVAQLNALVTKGNLDSSAIPKKKLVDLLKGIIRKERPNDEGYITALDSLAYNLHTLLGFAEHFLTGTYKDTTFTVCSLSKIKSGERFNNLGIKVMSGYAVDAMLRVAESVEFEALHACQLVSREEIPAFHKVLKNRKLLYPGDSEHVARATINAHIEFLFDQEHAISSMLELWLARLTSNHEPVALVHTNENHTYKTYLTGRTDYMVLTITSVVDRTPALFNAKGYRNDFLEGLRLPLCDMFSRLPEHLRWRLDANQGWEVLFLEAKSTRLFSRGKINVSHLYQIITTCCIARSSNLKGHDVVKFSLSSGHHWIFGVVDNTKEMAYVTTILDNSDFQSSYDVLHLLTLWMVLPGPMIRDHLFLKVHPRPQLSIIETSKSRAVAGKNIVDVPPKTEYEIKIPDKVKEGLPQEEEDEGDCADGEGEESEAESEELEEGSEREFELEGEGYDDDEETKSCGSEE